MNKGEFGNKPSVKEKRKENREPGNVEVQIIKEHIFIVLLQIQKEEEESLKLSL